MQSTSAGVNLPHALNEDVVAVARIVMKEHTGEDPREEDMVQFLFDNMELFMKHAREGRISQTEIDKLKQFVACASENTPSKVETDTRQATGNGNDTNNLQRVPCGSIDRWLDMLEKLQSACEAITRIGNLLQTLTLPGLRDAQALFTMLNNLPKFPRPGWESPAGVGKTQNRGSWKQTPFYVQIGHSLAWTSTGVLLSPTDTACLYGTDMRRILRPPIHGMLTGFQRARFFSLAARSRRVLDGRFEKTEEQEEVKEGIQSIKTKPKLMEVMEAYYGVMRLISFLGPFPGPEFDEIRGVLHMVRRVLQKELNDAIVRTDFDNYCTNA